MKRASSVCLIDSADDEAIFAAGWTCFKAGRYVSAMRTFEGKSERMMVHRLIMEPPDGVEIDHVNQDRFDNRRINLRLATRSQNMHNSNAHRNNTSGFKGVYYYRRHDRWRAVIRIPGKRITLGSFKTAEEAGAAYAAAASKLHGEFARY